MNTSNTPEGVEALMACPFCGCEAELVENWTMGKPAPCVRCTGCGAESAGHHRIEAADAIAAWNTRTALVSLSGGAQPVAKVDFDHAGGVKWLCNYADIPKDTQLYTHPPLSAGEAVAPDARRFRGPGHLEETGYIPAGSAAEREAKAASGEAVAQPVTEQGFFLGLAQQLDEADPELVAKLAMVDATGSTNDKPRLGMQGAIEVLGILSDIFEQTADSIIASAIPAPLPASPQAPVGDNKD